MGGWTAFNPDGTSYWVTAKEAFASFSINVLEVDDALTEFIGAATVSGRPSKAQRRNAKAVLATHRRLLRRLVDDRNPLGVLKRRYTGITTVAAMAREMQHSCTVVFCPPPVDARMHVSALCVVIPEQEPADV